MAIIGFGSTLTVTDGASNAHAAFTEVANITVPKFDTEFIDSSYLNMPDRNRRYVSGLIAPGEMTFEINYNKDDYTRILALRGTLKEYKITFPDSSTLTFSGFMMNAEIPVSVTEVMKIKCTVRVTGGVTFVEG